MKDQSNIIVRKMERHEIPILVEHRLFYLAELQGEHPESGKNQLKKDLESYFEQAFNSNRFFAFLAESEGKTVSFGGMVVKEIPGDFSKPVYLEGDILNMYTVPEFRKKGISTLILENLLNEAKLRGISKVALHTTKDGEKLYRNFGFSEPVYPYLERILNTENFTH